MPDRHSNSLTFTIVVPVKDEDSEVVKRIVEDTRTVFRGSVELHIVDDGSKVACPYSTLRHLVSRGYGAALKTGIRESKTEWVITMDGDGQHRIRDVQRLIEFVQDFPELDMVIGDRRLKESSFHRLYGRKCLNWIASFMAGRWINDLNSGLRVFRREVAIGYEPILSDRFSFTTSITMAMLTDSYKVDWLPIRVLPREKGVSTVKIWQDGWYTLKKIVVIGLALRTRRLRGWLRSIHSGS